MKTVTQFCNLNYPTLYSLTLMKTVAQGSKLKYPTLYLYLCVCILCYCVVWQLRNDVHLKAGLTGSARTCDTVSWTFFRCNDPACLSIVHMSRLGNHWSAPQQVLGWRTPCTDRGNSEFAEIFAIEFCRYCAPTPLTVFSNLYLPDFLCSYFNI